MPNIPKEIILQCLNCKSQNLSKDENEIVTCYICKEKIGYKELIDKTINLEEIGNQILNKSKPKGRNWK